MGTGRKTCGEDERQPKGPPATQFKLLNNVTNLFESVIIIVRLLWEGGVGVFNRTFEEKNAKPMRERERERETKPAKQRDTQKSAMRWGICC